jgi:tyrosyl-tRNA synthetase
MNLSYEIVKIYHGEKKAKESQDNWEKTFSKKEIPTEIESISIKEGILLVDVFISQKIVSSKNEFRRLIGEGAVTNMDKDEKVSSFEELAKNGVYKIGKKRFCKIKISD